MPLMDTAEAEAIIRAANPWHFRCLYLGLHKKADYLLPESRRPIARHTVCLRCGLLIDIQIL